jgi:hypothetical protein
MITEKFGLKGILEIYALDVEKHGDPTPENYKELEQYAEHVLTTQNLITNVGYQSMANRLTGSGTYNSTTYAYFAVGDGTTAPSLTRTAADFYADCPNDYTKAVTTIETFSVATLMQQWTCYLTSAENTVTSITKFALMNALVGTSMFNEVLFAAISKNSQKALYFKYKLYFTEV